MGCPMTIIFLTTGVRKGRFGGFEKGTPSKNSVMIYDDDPTLCGYKKMAGKVFASKKTLPF